MSTYRVSRTPRFRWILDSSFALAVLTFAGVVNATALNVDFGSFNSAPASSYGAASGQAGVWNQIGASGSTSGLVDTAGNAPGVSVSVAAGTMAGTSCGGGSGDFELLMCDNFYTAIGGWSVTFSGLTDGLYNVYLYDGLNQVISIGNGNANGVAFTSVNGSSSASMFSGSNVVEVLGVTVAGGQLALASPSDLSGLAGMQIVPTAAAVPEPGTLLLVVTALAGFVGPRQMNSARRPNGRLD